MATLAAYQTFRRVYNDPTLVDRQTLAQDRLGYYGLLLAYFENSVFDEIGRWSDYRSIYRLYRQTRSIYNPTRRLVNFYVEHVYKGRLSNDGLAFPDGTPSAIPFPDDTDEELLSAISQFWQWTNWQANMGVYVCYGAMTGNVLVEVVDELDRGKVTATVRWPGMVSEIELDAAGNVKAYLLEYRTIDEKGDEYLYSKWVDQEAFRFYKDDKPYDYGDGAAYENPYGFVPAVWAKHQDLGGEYGAPAMQGSLNKIDELNSFASGIHDKVTKIVQSPIVLWGQGGLGGLTDKPKAGKTDELSPKDAARESLDVIRGPAGGQMQQLELNLGDAVPYLEKLIHEIEHDFPELSTYSKLAEMSTLTGPAARRLLGNVEQRLEKAAANYDHQSVKLFAMAAAIGGFRLNSGAWMAPTPQQEKFRPFGLDSYERGDLDMSILPRQLLNPTDLEAAQEDQTRATTAKALAGIVSNREQIIIAGYTEEDADRILTEKEKDAPEMVAALPGGANNAFDQEGRQG